MICRRATSADVDALVAFPDDPALVGLPREQVRADVDARRMRPAWAWLIEDGGRLLGRALWWGTGAAPSALDALDLLPEVADPRSAAASLLRAGLDGLGLGGAPPPYTVLLPGRWREDEAAVRAAGWRRAAAADVGLTVELERWQCAWTPEQGVPAGSGRLTFRPGPDTEFVELFRQVARGSLDVETRRALGTTDALAQARDELAFYAGCPGDRDWWRVALEDGVPVGFVVPSATPYHRNVGYLGVLPEHRGRGLVDDLLAEVTRVHAAAGADRITATTDLTNHPTAAALDRAGYQVTEVRLVLEAPR